MTALESRPATSVADHHYLLGRLLDALLREDVQGLVSQSRRLPWADAPLGQEALPPQGGDACWLYRELAPGQELWLLVQPASFMQRWRSLDARVAARIHGEIVWLRDCDALLEQLAEALPPEAAALYADYAEECQVALEQRAACEAEKQRWFRELSVQGEPWPALPDWAERFLFYDRIAAFLDHPFYPSARAKAGLSLSDLAACAPEFQPTFQLCWVAVPCELFHAQLEAWPAFWPSFEQVGLPAELAADHVLLPVHPCLWQSALEGYLGVSGLRDRIIRAPGTALRVQPTLSVRTLQIEAEPRTHIKIPLTMRTLGSKNIRTVKPSTIADGHLVQSILGEIVAAEPGLRSRMWLTDESEGGHAGQNFLGFILRRYPAALDDATLVTIATLLAEGADGRLTLEHLAERFYDGDLKALLADYLDLTLALHLRLWLRYGIALESNQQNSVLALEAGQPLRLLLKDNDAARILNSRLAQASPALAARADTLQDRRILAEDELALAQMFVTITLQLNLAVPLEGLAARGLIKLDAWYARLRQILERELAILAGEGLDIALARRVLLKEDTLPAKYLLRAGSLESKAATGAADINKFYGQTAPNFLLLGGAP